MPKALAKPRKVCPFSGDALQFVQVSCGDWQVRGCGWVSTLFQTREQAEYHFSHSLGTPPKFPNPVGRYKIRERLTPVREVSDDIDASLAAGRQWAEDAVEIMTK
jgi:hypothetical protein